MRVTEKPRIIFVAGLTPIPGGGTGGQETVARALYESELSKYVEWLPISSTMLSVPPPSFLTRACAAGKRLVRFCWLLPSADVALIFAADGMSLVEKGTMAVIARICGRGVIIRTSSGFL